MGYINGSDALMSVGNKCVGHCTEHTVNYDTTTKERAVKAPETKGIDVSLFTETDITGLAITATFKGLQYDEEVEQSFEGFQALWHAHKPITVEFFRRPATGVSASEDRKPYLKAQFVITKLSETNTANDDASYDGELKMTGAPEIWTPKVEV